MDALEFQGWMTYASIEPIGEYRMDLRFAMLACTIANLVKGATGTKGKPSKIDDFMLKFDPPKQQSTDKMKSMMRMLSG
jgi:hypothetical protein